MYVCMYVYIYIYICIHIGHSNRFVQPTSPIRREGRSRDPRKSRGLQGVTDGIRYVDDVIMYTAG